MLKRIYLAIAGVTEDSDKRLGYSGAFDTVKISCDLRNTGHVPAVIFTDGVLSAVLSAQLMLEVVGARRVVNDTRLAWENSCHAHNGKDPLRKHFSTPKRARAFLSEICPLTSKDETVAFMTDRCWGHTFGCTWARSALYCFDLQSQSLHFVAYHGPSI